MFLANKLNKGAGSTADAQFNYVTMLLHGDGTNGAQNNTFLDSSTNNFTITRNGNTTQGSFSPYGSNWSNFFATSAAVRFPYTSSLTSWWTQDFTMEMWIFNNTNAVSGTNSLPLQFAHGVYNSTPTFWSFGTNASGQVEFYYFNGSGIRLTSTTTASLGTWNHISMVYTNSSGNISLYLNGVSVASATKSGTPQNSVTSTVNIGAVQNTYYNGYISNFRVLNGTALYTTTFTPSTTPLTAITNTQLLTCQSNGFKDNSTNNATPTIIGTPSVQRFNPFGTSTAYSTSVIGGSGYFDGSGDYLTAANNSAFQLGTGNFTIECWYYAQDISLVALFGLWGPSSSNVSWLMYTSGSGFPIWYTSTNGSTANATLTSSIAITANAWNHIVIERVSGTTTIYVNGASGGNTATSVNLFASTSQLTIGYNPIGGTPDNVVGYLSDVRIVKGSSVYNGTFTPPTAPLTAVSGTSLLINYTNGAIFDNAMINNLETVGAAQISTSVVKYGTGSLYINASTAGTDYFVQPSSESVNFATGNFTIEFWMNPTSTTTNWATGSLATIMDTDAPVGTGTTWWVVHQNNAAISFASNSATILTSSSVLSANVWQHVAIVRNGSTVTIYVDGTSAGSVTYSTTIGSNRRLIIGTQLGSSRWYKGYLDDIRITKGYARYTATFTPPNKPLSDTGPI
jgi:hypothetical protein